MASWGLRSLLISTSFEVFLTDQTLPEFNLQTNHITFCCPEYSNNFLHKLVNLTWLHVLLSLVSWRVHLCCQGMQIPGKCKRLGDKSYKNCFKLPPGMWRWGTRGVVPGMTENPGFYQLLPNVIPQIPALQRRTQGEPAEFQKQTQKEKSCIQQIIPKGALLLWTLCESKALLEGSLHQCHSWRIKTLGSTGQVPNPQPTLTCTRTEQHNARTKRNCF